MQISPFYLKRKHYGKETTKSFHERMTDFERTAYRNEIDFLQHEVERYREQNRQLMEMIFKIKDKLK